MHYVIHCTEDDQYEMVGEREDILGVHLVKIMRAHNIRDDAWSESHALHILHGHGITVDLIDHHGDPVEY